MRTAATSVSRAFRNGDHGSGSSSRSSQTLEYQADNARSDDHERLRQLLALEQHCERGDFHKVAHNKSIKAFVDGVSAAVTAVTESEIIWVFVASGLLVYLVRIRPGFGSNANALMPWSWWLTGLHGPAPASTLWKIGIYFAEAGAFVFGSGLAIVPFLHHGVVEQHQWLTEQQFLDAVAVAMITPGPVVITVAFIGTVREEHGPEQWVLRERQLR
jgi:hypothetical protein